MTLVYLRRDRTSLLPGLLSFDLPCFHIVCHPKDCVKFQYNLTPPKMHIICTNVCPCQTKKKALTLNDTVFSDDCGDDHINEEEMQREELLMQEQCNPLQLSDS